MEDIIDIRDPITLGFSPWVVYAVIGALIAAVLVALFIAGVMKHYASKRQPKRSGEFDLAPEALAQALLNEAESMIQGDVKAFYFYLTGVLKGYLKVRFRFNAVEMTTEELLPVIERLAVDAPVKTGVKQLLKYADPVKYADFSGKPDCCAAHIAMVRRFVAETTPSSGDQPNKQTR